MIKLLRYNSRITLYFPGDGAWPQFNPVVSSSHTKSGKRTRCIYEPLWLFRLRQRLFCFASAQRCPERGLHRAGEQPLPDTWNKGPDGNRTCSCCGSIHPDDLMAICRKTLTDPRYGVEGTTKGYKVYVRQPDVCNAGQGAIKFYMWHAPQPPSPEAAELFSHARRLTWQRIEAQFKQRPAA
jgi:hypothetical protein